MGIRFAIYLADDVKERCSLIMEDISYLANDAALVLQLTENQLA